MPIYDEVSAHWEKLPGDLPRKAAGTHIGMFLAWALKSGLGSPMHERQHADALAKLTRRWTTGRDYLLDELDGVLADEHLSEEGDAFAEAYYLSGDYLRDYDEHLRGHSPSVYHVRDDHGIYDRLKPVLDARLAAWRRERETAAAAPAPVPATPPAEPTPPAALAPTPAPAAPPPAPAVPPPGPAARQATAPAARPRGRRRATKQVQAPHRTVHTWRRKRGSKAGLGILLFILAAVGGWFWLEHQADRHRARRVRRHTDRHMDEQIRQIQEALDRARRSRTARRAFRREVPARERTRQPGWPRLTEMQVAAAAELGVAAQFENPVGMRFVLVPAGTFVMGSPPSEQGRHAGEVAHNVVVKTPFYLQVAEVSNALFRRFRPSHRSESPPGLPSFDEAGQPATSVGYQAARSFGQWVQQRDPEHRYRLPREAEWEYACRAGTMGRFWWGDSERDAGRNANVADWSARSRWPLRTRTQAEAEDPRWRWFDTKDAHAVPAPVASFHANVWGLYDMLGNVHEWCADWAGSYEGDVAVDPVGPLHGTHRILRGGAFDTPVWMTRCAYRGGLEPGKTQMNLGFRLVAELPDP